MTDEQKAIAQQCKRGAEEDTMTFPEIVGTLVGAGFEGYSVDFRRGATTYYTADGDLIDLEPLITAATSQPDSTSRPCAALFPRRSS